MLLPGVLDEQAKDTALRELVVLRNDSVVGIKRTRSATLILRTEEAKPFWANIYSSVVYIATPSSSSYSLSVLRISGVLSVLAARTLNPYCSSTCFFYA